GRFGGGGSAFAGEGSSFAEERTIGGDVYVGAAEFAEVAAGDLAAELGDHGLLAVADAEDGDAHGEDRVRRAGGACFGDGGGAAGEDDALRGVGGDSGGGR